MKKLLALVLALVMTLGLATVSSSAAYSDKADIEYTEAADVMTALGVFQGKGDAFAPKDNLNRAEAAKLIAYLMLGNKTAESMTGSGTRFTDVPASHWAAGFIEYLASVGIVSGVGNNQFNPNGQVTAVQFAKMLLVALGYDADLEGFVGEGWSINIQKLANKNDLFETLDIGTNDALTREQAAQMCLNDLKADMVKYSDKGTTVKIGESTVVTGAKEAAKDEDVGNKNYNNSKDANGDKKYLQLAESLYGNDIKLDEGRDDFGRPTNTWNYKNIKVGEYTDNAQLIATATEKFSRKSLYDALGKDQYDNIKDGKTALYAYEDGVETRVTAANLATYMDRNDTSAINNSGNGSLTQVYLNDDGANDVVRVVTSHTYVWQVTNDYNATRGDVTIKAVGLSTNDGNGSKPNDHIINLKDKTLKDDDFEAVKGLKKDDYVLITAYKDGTGYEVDSVAKAELKTGKVDSFTKADTVTIDGTKTKYSNMAPGNNEQKGALYTVGEEARFVMDKYGYVIAVDELVVNNNYVFVANIASTGGLNTNPEGDAYFTDGTNEAIRINKVGTDDGKNAILGKDVKEKNIQTIGAFSNSTRNAVSSNAGWYTYSKASDGKYNLNKLSSSYLQVGYVYNAAISGDLTDVVSNDKVNFLAGQSAKATQLQAGNFARLYTTTVLPNTLRANDKTIFVVEQDGDVNVYTGLKNAPNVNLANATSDKAVVMVAYDSGNSYAKYVYITLTDKAEVDGGQNTALFYVLKRDTEDVITDQKDYEMWYVIDESGKDVLVKTDTGFMSASTLYRAYYKTFKNSDDEYTKVSEITNSSAAIAAAPTNTHYIEAIGLTSKNGDTNDITYNNGSLFVGGVGFTTTSDTKIILVIQGNGAADMKVNTDKKYEIENYTNNGDGLEQKFNDYSTYTYDVQGRIGGNYPGDTDLKEIYITVTAAKKIPSGSSGTVYSDKISRDAFIGTDAEFMQTLQAMLNKGNVTITDSNVVLPSGYTLIVPADTTLTTSNLVNRANITIWGDMVVNGNLDDYGHIDNRSSLKVTGTDNNIGGASIVTYVGATTAFTSDKAVVKVTGTLNTEGSLTIGAEGKTTAKLEIASGATVTFAATADVTVEGNLDVKAGATVTAKNTDPIIVAGTATVAADTATNNGAGTGVIAVGDSSNSNIADGDLTKTSTDLVNAVANAETAVDKCVKTYLDNEFVKKAVADELNLNSKDSDLTTAANNAKDAFKNKTAAQVKELASYDEDKDTCSGTQIDTIKSAGEALVTAAKTAVKKAAKDEIGSMETELTSIKTSAEKVAKAAGTAYASAISKATTDVTDATTVAAVTKAVNDAKTAGTTLTNAVKAAEADEIARVQALLENSGVTIDKDTTTAQFANAVKTAIEGEYKTVTAVVGPTTGSKIDDAYLTNWTTAGVNVLVTLTCGTTAASQGFAVTVTAGD